MTAPVQLDARAGALRAFAGADAAVAELEDVIVDPDEGAPFTPERLRRHRDLYALERGRALRAYIEALPRVPVSRCPFSDELVHHSLDVEGVDGLWWRSELPARPPEQLPETFVAMTGALDVEGEPPRTSFVVQPGPGAPYVFPALLSGPGEVSAVISSIRVGRWDGYVVCYFSERREEVLARVPAWGGGLHRWSPDSPLLLQDGDPTLERDFELGPWVDRRALRWVAPGDDEFALQETVLDCPYLDLPGPRHEQWLLDGRAFDPASDETPAAGSGD